LNVYDDTKELLVDMCGEENSHDIVSMTTMVMGTVLASADIISAGYMIGRLVEKKILPLKETLLASCIAARASVEIPYMLAREFVPKEKCPISENERKIIEDEIASILNNLKKYAKKKKIGGYSVMLNLVYDMDYSPHSKIAAVIWIGSRLGAADKKSGEFTATLEKAGTEHEAG